LKASGIQPPPLSAAAFTEFCRSVRLIGEGDVAVRIANALAGGSVSAYVGPLLESPPAMRAAR
jgi:hypothetical protein